MDSKNNLPFAIMFSAVVIGASLIYLSTRMTGGGLTDEDLQAQILKGIDSYVQDQQKTAQAAQAEANKPKFVEGDFSDDDAFSGNEDAKVTIVEFSDFQCPYCGKYSTSTYTEVKKNYVDTGKVKYVFRDLPLSFHPGAYPAALSAECVRDQKGDKAYFEMHDKIFADQSILSSTDPKGALRKLAIDVGVNEKDYDACVTSDKFKAEIDKDTADAASIGINGTPGFIVGGQIISGALPYAAFESAIESALKK
ncbi:MAG: DsbA family protein [Candidatus Gracilibacteria bacterium]|jgi:protein-disulfide isomerase